MYDILESAKSSNHAQRNWSDEPVLSEDVITCEIANQALQRLEIDDQGLDQMDRNFLSVIVEKFSGGPVGLENLAAILSEQKDVIEDVIEPYLMQKAFIQRTPRGRIVTALGYQHLGLTPPTTQQSESDLFNA